MQKTKIAGFSKFVRNAGNVVAEVAKNYPQIQTLFTALDLGGWDAIEKKFFANGATFDKIQAQVASKA